MPTVDSRRERIYVQNQTAFRDIPQSGGAASLANGDASNHTSVTVKHDRPLVTSNDKVGTRSPVAGVQGRRSGS